MRRWLFICSLVCYVVSTVAQVPKAPAFTPQQLASPPTTGWLTNGGSLSNQRYSPLALINRDNVS
jgi:glucose dehydrogenase